MYRNSFVLSIAIVPLTFLCAKRRYQKFIAYPHTCTSYFFRTPQLYIQDTILSSTFFIFFKNVSEIVYRSLQSIFE